MSDLSWLDAAEQRTFRAFARSARQLFAQFDRELQRDLGMPRTYFEILWLLHDAPGQSLRMSDLAEATASQPSRITHAVARLEELRQVRRELCVEDRRGFYTVLTDEGLEMLRIAAPRYAESIRRHFIAPLSHTQQAQLTRIGETLLSTLAASRLADVTSLADLGIHGNATRDEGVTPPSPVVA
jgi:DNA-binding MarR family transcriptional regulator